MHEFRFLPLKEFEGLPVEEQHQYVRGVAAHLAEATRIHERALAGIATRSPEMVTDVRAHVSSR